MTKHTIRLPGGEWTFDDAQRLGAPGGFGEVFRGAGAEGEVAVKRLKLDAHQAAHRELNISNQLMQRALVNVVPVLDAGQDANSDRYFIVMPICDLDLAEFIQQQSGGLTLIDKQKIIESIVLGLSEVHDITHRDLKPSNILFHDNRWKIADFGIAKFVEDSTSIETLRRSLTPPYAAPEQWSGERPSETTDVYALGCIIHTLLGGNPPFTGDADDLREQHLHTPAPKLSGVNGKIAAFVTQMLRKPQEARPNLARCLAVLGEASWDASEASLSRSALSEAAGKVATKEAQEEARRLQAETRHKKRRELFDFAKQELGEIRGRLFDAIADHYDGVEVNHRGTLIFGDSGLEFRRDTEFLDDMNVAIHKDRAQAYESAGWDVIGWSKVSVACDRNMGARAYAWNASLLFGRKNENDSYRWYELAFFNPWKSEMSPFALDGYEADLYFALSTSITHSVNLAYGPCPIDGENEDEFIDRWIGLVAKAATGDLRSPTSFPITSFCDGYR